MNKKLYRRFSPEEDFADFDHIIIGSGIGGLTAATWLAKAGKKVAVFERHYVPGGFMHSFKRRKGFEWDVGVHYIGNVGEGEDLRGFFDLLTESKLDWEPLGEVYDVIKINGNTYEFKAGEEEFRKQLIRYFPEEKKAINRYLRLIRKASGNGNAFFFEKTFKPFLSKTIGWMIRKWYENYSQKTTLEVLNKITRNRELIAVLCGQCGNYGLSPESSSFAAHAIVTNHFLNGGYYPKGGSVGLCEKILETLNNLGGRVYINAEVEQIITEKNKVKGIRIDGHTIPSKSVISDVGVENTFNRLLSEKDRRRCNFDLNGVQPSSGHMCLYLGLDKSSKELKLPKHNIWYYEDENLDRNINSVTLENAPDKFAYISFPSAKDPEWEKNHPGTATIQALSVGKYDWFTPYEDKKWMNRGKEYEKLKENFKNTMLNKIYEFFPQVKGHVTVSEVSSPLSTRHFSNYRHGEIYGLAHSPERFKLPFLRPETKIKGLRLTGQDITLVGVSGAMLSGMICATTILKFKVWKIFREISRLKNKK